MTFATDLTDARGLVAIAAAAIAVIALLGCALLAAQLRRVKRDQRVVLGGGERDLAGHAAALQDAFEAQRDYVTDLAEGLEARLGQVERSLLDAVAHTALVHYDAYNELSGQQSVSIALLDGARSGVVLTCIHHRDQARVYAKHLINGESERELSPEEAEAVRLALAAPRAAEAHPGRPSSAAQTGQLG